MKDVERFMKHYFLIAKDVGDLTAILCAELEDQQAKPAPVLSRMMAKLRPRGRRPLTESRGLPRRQQPAHGRRRRTCSRRDPVNLIRMFRLAQKHNLVLHPDAMRAVNKSLKLIDGDLRAEPRGQPAVPGNPDVERC